MSPIGSNGDIVGFRERLELRRSNAAQRHRNRYRERKTGQCSVEALTDAQQGLIDYEEEFEVFHDV